MEDLGSQGGDPQGLVGAALDLSTCVNPYGPPGSVMEALRGIPGEAIRCHPYRAASQVVAAYADSCGGEPADFIAGQGTSEFIWNLAGVFSDSTAGLPLPAYTEFLQAFPKARKFGDGSSTHTADIIDRAMTECGVVLISNPHNPTGQTIPAATLLAVSGDHPDSILVVDESYIDFLPDPEPVTVIGASRENVVAIRSPSKFYGMAGLRAGVLWTRNRLRSAVERRRTRWPVTSVAAEAVACALRDGEWAANARRLLRDDARWLGGALERAGLRTASGELHFRLVLGTQGKLDAFTSMMEKHGVLVRVLSPGHGVGMPSVRISAPRSTDRWILSRALADFAGTPMLTRR